MKRLISVVVSILYILMVNWPYLTSGGLIVHFLDVGQGDAIYIQTPGKKSILIDGGEGVRVLEELGEVVPPWRRKIDLVILTHPHSDHIGGLIEVLKRYEVKEVWMYPIGYKTPEFHEFMSLIISDIYEVKITFPQKGYCYSDENISLCTLWPSKNIGKGGFVDFMRYMENENVDDGKFFDCLGNNVNNCSIVLLLSYGVFDVLLPGDAEVEVEMKLSIGLSKNNHVEVLKAGHHCSKTASSEKLLKKIRPEIAICSCGKGNKFGHPHKETLDNFERYKIEYFRTDEMGRISVWSDGNDWKLLKS